MPPLKNKKREQFVQAFPKSATRYGAYEETYHCEGASARVGASKLLAVPEVQNRLLEVFEAQGINDGFITDGLKRLTSANKENVQLGAYRTILEVRKDIDSAAKIGIQVNTGDILNHDRRLEILQKYAAKNKP